MNNVFTKFTSPSNDAEGSKLQLIVYFRCNKSTGADLGGGCRGCAPLPEMTCGFLIQLVFCKKKNRTIWFIDVEVEQETSAPPLKKILDPPLKHVQQFR